MNRILRNQRVWALALGVVLTPALASAQQATAAPAPGQQAPSTVDRYVPGQAIPEVPAGSTMVPMTLEQAMDRALEKNLSLKAARLNPQSVDYQLASARAAFSPQLTGLYSYRDAASPNNNRLEERLTVNTIGQNFNVGMSQTTPWYGGRLTASFNNSRSASNSSQAQRNPAFNAGLQFNYTQPLLAGFRIDNSRNQLRTLSVQRQIADIQLLTTIENTKATVRTAYWNLRQAIEQIEIQRRSLALAQRLYEENRIKVEIGTLAPIETTTSEAQVANAEQALLNAQIQWRTAELAIKQLLADSPQDELYSQTINPIETAPEVVTEVDIPAAVKRALAERTDLTQSRRNLEVSQLNLALTGDQTKPQLDLSGGYGLSGQGGPLFSNGVITTPGGWGQALSALSGFDVPTWNFQFNFTYPLFMRAAKANYARAQLQLQQSIAQLQAQELQVSTLVTNAGYAVENSYKQFQAARKAREVAERNADAEQTRFDVGMSTNYNVVQAQNNLTSQRLTELRAIISYLNAIAEFERVQRFGNTGGN
jgi:outer membrane protein